MTKNLSEKENLSHSHDNILSKIGTEGLKFNQLKYIHNNCG